jgi:hypothetical protein
LCGFEPNGGVLVDQARVDETLEVVRESLVDRFDVQAVLKLGERSFVYLAREFAHDRLVALKVMPVPSLVEPEMARRFERQAQLAANLKHSHIVPIYNFGSTRQFLWYAMEHEQGQSLAEVLRAHGPLDLESTLRIAEQVASALDYAHRVGVVHGNLKPENIFIDEGRWVRVSDFATMDVFGKSHPGQGGTAILQRPEYLAPEQFYARSVGASADQYAFAVILYQCLSGTLPFVGDSYEEVARQHANEPPPRLSEHRPDLPLYVLDGIQRALAKVPGGRFPTVLDMVAALKSGPPRASGARLSPTRQSAASSAVLTVDYTPPGKRRRRALLFSIVAVVVAGGSLAIPEVREAVDPAIERFAAMLGFQRQAPRTADPIRWQTTDPVAPPRRPADSSALVVAPAPTNVQASPPAVRSPQPTRRVPPVPVSPGRLFVSATPWGVLYIDGQRMGNTPKADIELTPGAHRIRIERDGFEPYETDIEVASADTLRLTGIVLTPRQR